jgi:hypothetical protein
MAAKFEVISHNVQERSGKLTPNANDSRSPPLSRKDQFPLLEECQRHSAKPEYRIWLSGDIQQSFGVVLVVFPDAQVKH